jgi:hypothetical protein
MATSPAARGLRARLSTHARAWCASDGASAHGHTVTPVGEQVYCAVNQIEPVQLMLFEKALCWIAIVHVFRPAHDWRTDWATFAASHDASAKGPLEQAPVGWP